MADFERRAGQSGVDHVPGTDWRYLTVHPCADEKEVLKRLALEPSDCQSVDAYWHVGPDVALLQVRTLSAHAREATGIWLRVADNSAYLFNVVGIVEAPNVTHDILKTVMLRLAKWGFTGKNSPRTRHIGEKLTRIDG